MMVLMHTLHQLSAVQHLLTLHFTQHIFNLPTDIQPTVVNTQQQVKGLGTFIQNVENLVYSVGIALFAIGVIVAGIMRVVSFGSDRRIAVSNMALTAAVIGLVIILAASGITDFITGAFK